MTDTPPCPSAGDGPVHRQRGLAYAVASVLLVAPFVALLWVSSYARVSPRLWGFPFFYWYQLMWVLIASVLTFLSYLLIRGTERRRGRLPERSVR